jgi:hypothetical protein
LIDAPRTTSARARRESWRTEAIIDSGIVVTALKEITQRARPLTGKDRSKFFAGGSSFPSGPQHRSVVSCDGGRQ